MKTRIQFLLLQAIICGIAATHFSYTILAEDAPAKARVFQAGAATVDITPTTFPVIVNGNFLEASANKAFDALHVRSFVLDDGTTRIAFAVVDTCMMPRDLIDRAKELAAKESGIRVDHIVVSATHTHSAPSSMGCLGSRLDKDYAEWLPAKIAEAIIAASKTLQPVRIGWAVVDDWEHTFNRRWLRRSDKMLTDPFGQRNVRAMMHPGYMNADTTGPSGPVDPGLSVLSVQTRDGKPLALLANYSQHYFGTSAVSADYYGFFCKHIAKLLGQENDGNGPGFVGIMSQGTSGDLARYDYGQNAQKSKMEMDLYAAGVASKAFDAFKTITHQDWVPLDMVEEKVTLNYRVPDDARLEWAKKMVASFEGRLPKNQPEIYAQETIILHERQKTELKLQAIRIGDLGIAAIPNEVFCITGLKLKMQSPFPTTFNMSLANGAEGYIPPPEQHKLGGYTTWPARTAGLETDAEPKIVETLLGLFEKVSAKKRRALVEEHGAYVKAVLDSKPAAYWRMNDIVVPLALDASGNGHPAQYEDGVALYLDGPEGAAFSGAQINRSAHFAGGRMTAESPVPKDRYSVEFWFWNPIPDTLRPVTGYLFSMGPDGDKECPGEHFGIGGTFKAESAGRLILFNGNKADEMLAGKTRLALKQWHHAVLVRDGKKIAVYLDGNKEPEINGELASTVPAEKTPLFFGGRSDNYANFEGKLDEIAVYDRALTADDAVAHFRASGLSAPKAAAPVDPPALSAEESLKKIHVREGFEVELVASEPLVKSPVAFDWDGQGRLFVVEMADYPMGMDGKGKRGGRVRMLEDTDGDGRYDKSTIFAGDLNFPNGILTWRDGVLVTAAPDILYLRAGADDKAGEPERILSGFMEGNQQLRVNGLRWGLDNWVYCAIGGHHGNYGAGTKISSPRSKQETQLGSRDFRFRPDSGELNPQSGPTQFGRNRDDWGNWFGVQNSLPLWQYVLADHYTRRNPFVVPPNPVIQMMAERNPRVYPVSPPDKRYHSFTDVGRYTSACSAMIDRGDFMFGKDSFLHAFTCEPVSNLIQHNILAESGVTFTSHRDGKDEEHDFFASEDKWTRPVMVRTGPDGALYVADMYRRMIEHPEWLPQNGKDELLPYYRLGENAGRIYRIFPKGKRPGPIPKLDAKSNAELAELLGNSNGWIRDKAQMMLLWRDARDTVPALEKMALSDARALGRLHAACTLDGLNELKPEIVAALLADKDAHVRTNAVRLAERHSNEQVIAAAVKLTDDGDAKVRMQLACSLGEWTDPRASAALARLLARDSSNVYITGAVFSSALPHLAALANTPEVAQGDWRQPPVAPLLQSALGAGDGPALAALLRSVRPKDMADMRRYSVWLEVLASKGMTADAVAAKLNHEPLRQAIHDMEALPALASEMLQKDGLSSDDKMTLGLIVALSEKPSAEPPPLFQRWLQADAAPEDQERAIRLLARLKRADTPALLLRDWNKRTPALRSVVLDSLMSSEAWTLALLAHVKEGAVATSAFDAQRLARLRQHPSAKVKAATATSFQDRLSVARADVIEKFKPALTLQGDAAHGKEVFAQLCTGCHRKNDVGKEVGPDLRSVVEHAPEKLLVSILDPSASIEPGYVAFNCKLRTGEHLYGIIATETAESISFKLADGNTRAVLRSEIADLRSTQTSLMPDGLEATLTPQSLADLIRYLKTVEEKK